MHFVFKLNSLLENQHGREREACLNSRHVDLLQLGNNITCHVRSWYAKYTDIKGPFYSSDPYYAGILINPKMIDPKCRRMEAIEVEHKGNDLTTVLATIVVQNK